MAIQRPDIGLPVPLEVVKFARNGQAPTAAVAGRVLSAYNHVVAYRRKLIFSKGLQVNNVPAGSATTLTPWRAYCRTGYAASGAIRLKFITVGLPTATSSADPRVVWTVVGVGSTEALRVGVNTGTLGPNDFVQQIATIDVAANTEYEIYCQLINRGRIVSAAIWEEHDSAFEDGDTGVASRDSVNDGDVITDAQANDLLFTGHNLWLGNAAPVLSWCTDQDPDNGGAAPTRSTASYANVFDQAVTSVTDNSRGFLPAVQFHNPAHSTDVPIVFAVYAHNTSSAGGAVRLVDASGAIATVSSFATGGEWKTATGVLSGLSHRHKVDVHFQGDGSNNLVVHAFAVYEYAT